MGRFLKNCARLLRPVPKSVTAFSGEKVGRQKHLQGLNCLPENAVQKLGAGRNC